MKKMKKQNNGSEATPANITPMPDRKWTEEDRSSLRLIVRTREDYQAQRKSLAARLGIKADGTAMNIETRPIRKSDRESVIVLMKAAEAQEKACEKLLESVLERFPIWTDYLQGIDGCGPIAAAYIISEIDIHIAETVSKIWQYAGLNPNMVRGVKRVETKKPLTYQPGEGCEVIRRGNPKRGEYYVMVRTNIMVRGDKRTKDFVCPFNMRLRTALLGVMATCMVKAGLEWAPCDAEIYETLPDHLRDIRDKTVKVEGQKKGKKVKNVQCQKIIHSPYVQIMEDAKFRYEHSEQMTREMVKGGVVKNLMWKECTDGHRHRAAIRIGVKRFLADLYAVWRKMEGLEVRAPYHEGVLGHVHSKKSATA